MFKKIFSIILAITMCLPLLVACNDNNPKPAQIVELSANGLADYVIVYSDEEGSTAEKTAAEKISTAINTALGITVSAQANASSADDAKVIVIDTAEKVTASGKTEYLRTKDTAVALDNSKIMVIAGSADMLDSAADAFIGKLAAGETATVLEQGITVTEGTFENGYVYIDGVAIERYDIVYPEGCDLLTYYTAVALNDYFVDIYGISLDVKSDKEIETVYEILIGKTNRILDVDTSVELGDNQYVLCKDEAKVVMLGNGYMIAGGASALINKYASAGESVDITTLPTTAQVETFSWLEPKSVIYMIGDGMGFQHVEAGKELRDMPVFFAELYPYSIKVRTYSYSVDPLREADSTDSAAAGTALATGYKTINSYLGMNRNNEPIQNIRELADSKGAKTAILTTDGITGATPSAFLCHHNSRFDSDILQGQIDVLVENGDVDYCVGEGNTEDLTEYAREALSTISKDGDPFFIMIEEAFIDKESHNQNLATMPDKVVRFNDCIAYCTAFAVIHPDTIVLVTADHETGSLKKNNAGWNFATAYHSNSVVPLYALGYEGLSDLIGTKRDIDNTSIPKFIAKVLYGVDDFGDQEFGK